MMVVVMSSWRSTIGLSIECISLGAEDAGLCPQDVGGRSGFERRNERREKGVHESAMEGGMIRASWNIGG